MYESHLIDRITTSLVIQCNPNTIISQLIRKAVIVRQNWLEAILGFGIVHVCVCVCVGLLRAHYAPLQWYLGYLCTSRAQYAPPRRYMHHGAQGRLYFLKNSGDPDDFLFWWFTENIHKICLSGKCPCGSV